MLMVGRYGRFSDHRAATVRERECPRHRIDLSLRLAARMVSVPGPVVTTATGAAWLAAGPIR
jgi:hypothetical protein